MGEMERESTKRRKRQDVSGMILQSVATAGILSTALVAPNVLGAFDALGLIPSSRQEEIITRARKRLLKRGYLERTKDGLRLSQKGKSALNRFQMQSLLQERPLRWDRKWRVLIFDIPEKKRILRDRIRKMLEHGGFVRLQDSVWLYPYDCEDAIALLKADLKVGNYMLYMIVDSLEGDGPYRIHFDLPQRR